MPDKSSPWAEEGTHAHEILEQILVEAIKNGYHKAAPTFKKPPHLTQASFMEMMRHGVAAANFILTLHEKLKNSDILVEQKVHLSFIHPDMFGTFDGAVIDYWGTLHVFDYKYGAGTVVNPTRNLQMIFYGIGLAHRYGWNFKRVRLWIVQPRIKGYDGPVFWDTLTVEIKRYEDKFRRAVEKVEKNPEHFVEGAWCHWCKAKSVCPLKQEKKNEAAKFIFTHANLPLISVHTENSVNLKGTKNGKAK